MPGATDELLRARRKMVAYERARRRIIQRLADIDWELDELKPMIESLDEVSKRGELPSFEVRDDEK